MSGSLRAWVTAAVVLVCASSLYAQTFRYQGLLLQDGQRVTGSIDLQATLWDSPAGGAQIGALSEANGVAAVDGRFTVDLDFGAGVFNGDARWIEISVRAPSGVGSYVPLLTRQVISATPYAHHAMSVDGGSINGGPINSAILPTGGNWSLASTLNAGAGTLVIDPLSSRVGIGTASPMSPLHVQSDTGLIGLQVEHMASTGDAWGISSVSSSSAGIGVRGEANSIFGITYGGYFQSSSPSGLGVFGHASAASGNNYGGWFATNSGTGRGVYGIAVATTGNNYGVYGRSDSSGGIGVFGEATALDGQPSGGRFETYSSNGGAGVIGSAVTLTGNITYGVYGSTMGTFGIGVYGQANGGAPRYGVFSAGNFSATGTKAFRIDHPDDPANRYLLHYSVESPEVINFYRGTVVLDAQGTALVELPAYFGKINRDPSYVLTAVGAPMPSLHISSEIDAESMRAGAAAGPETAAPICSFEIAGGAPGGKVSWRVEAVRNDRWMQQYGAKVEMEKHASEKGTYQHPELYGLPQTAATPSPIAIESGGR